MKLIIVKLQSTEHVEIVDVVLRIENSVFCITFLIHATNYKSLDTFKINSPWIIINLIIVIISLVVKLTLIYMQYLI